MFSKRNIFISIILVFIVFHAADTLHAKNKVEFDWFWILYEYEKNPNVEIKIYRPPFYLKNTYSSMVFKTVLMPIYWNTTTKRKDESKYVLGLWSSVNYIHSNGVYDKDIIGPPLWLYGDSQEQKDQYLFIWPVGGTIKGKLAQDKINAYIFPGFLLFFIYPPSLATYWPLIRTIAIFLASILVPVYTEYQSRDYIARGLLWPFIRWGKGNKRDTFRFFPLYSRNYKEDFYDNRSYFFIFNHQKVFLRNDIQETFFALPFYGRRWNHSNNANSSTLLWPFFSWGYDKTSGDYELNFPWPLVQLQDCINPYIKKRIFFPFYGLYEFRNQKTFFITPLYFTLERKGKNFSSEYNFYGLIFWHFKREYIKEPSPKYGNKWEYVKLWPIFQYERDDRGNKIWNILSILPWRDPDVYERLYQPIWTLFEYRRYESGEKRMGFILRIYYQRWSKDFLYIKIPIIFSYGERNDKVTRFSLLLSMFSYTFDSEGKYIRLFWIPIRLGNDVNKDEKVVKKNEGNENINNPIYSYYDISHASNMITDYKDDRNRFIFYKKGLF